MKRLGPETVSGSTGPAGRWMVFGIISTCYLFVYFHRVSTSVIAPDLLKVFQTNATALGFMSSMYFYLYALEQPVVGFLADRLGPRRVIGLWTLVAACGCFIFGFAPNIGWAAAGRGLIGFGVGGVYVPALKAFSQWFKKRQFTTMTGLLLSVGNFGAIVATAPLAWTAQSWGWRSTFHLIGGATLVLGFGTLFLLRDHPDTERPYPVSASASQTDGTSGAGGTIRQVLCSLRFWILGVTFFGVFGTYLTFQGLWATPSLMSFLELDRMAASQLNMLVPIGFMIGAPLTGWVADRIFTHKLPVFITVQVVAFVLWLYLALGAGTATVPVMIPLLFMMGASMGGFASLIWSLVRDTTRPEILGLTSGLLNPAPFLGVALFQLLTGSILDRVGRVNDMYPTKAYGDAFLLCALIMAACLVITFVFRNVLSPKS